MIAARNSLRPSGMLNRCSPTDMAPALWPKSVTLSGSPPKALILLGDPAQGEALVEDAVIAGEAELGDGQEAQGTQAVVQGDDHDIAGGGEVGAVVDGQRARAVDEGAAMEEDHDRQALAPCTAACGVQTFRNRQSSESPVAVPSCGQIAPNAVALRGLVQAGRGCGAAQRRAPTGGWA